VHHSLGRLLPYEGLSGIGQAITLVADAIRARSRILVVADFDAGEYVLYSSHTPTERFMIAQPIRAA